VVQLPVLSHDATIATLRQDRPVVLVAPPGPVDRQRLTVALDTLRRMHIPCAGIVITETNGRRITALT
jgi:Mrp family chromosome partitioning ATPase